MDVRIPVAEIEVELSGLGISVAGLCREAELSPVTWMRWKRGIGARRSNWERVLAAMAKVRSRPTRREAA